MAEATQTSDSQTAAVATAPVTEPKVEAPSPEQKTEASEKPRGPDGKFVKQEAEVGKALTGAPAEYEFQIPDGLEIDDDSLQAFANAARDADLPQDAAQKLFEGVAPAWTQAFVAKQQAAMETLRTQWSEDSKADKEFGGTNLKSNLGIAKKALDQFGSTELKRMLDETGFGNHREVIRFFWKVGKAISEDSFVGGSDVGRKSVKELSFAEIADRVYPKQ